MNELKSFAPKKIKVGIKSVLDIIQWIKSYRKVPILLENRYGVTFILYPWNKTFIKLAVSGHDHDKEFAALGKLVKNGSTVFDIGANIGLISTYLSKLTTESGVVYSFEPVTKTYEMLTETIAINKRRNIITHKLGISNTVGTTNIFTFNQEMHTLNSLGKVNIGGNIPKNKEIIELTTLDNFCEKENIDYIDILKVDVEGFEDAVFEGARRILNANKVRYIQFEISEMPLESIGKSSDDIFKILSEFSYNIYRFNPDRDKFEGPISTRDNDFDNYYASKEDMTLIS